MEPQHTWPRVAQFVMRYVLLHLTPSSVNMTTQKGWGVCRPSQLIIWTRRWRHCDLAIMPTTGARRLIVRYDRKRAYLNQIIGRQQQVIEEQRSTIPEEEM